MVDLALTPMRNEDPDAFSRDQHHRKSDSSRNVAQPGSALEWGSRGRGFESRRSDQSQPQVFGWLHCFMSYFGYILRSSVNGQYYVGQTSDIIRRVALHNAGRVDSTKRYLPWELVYSVKFDSRSEAIAWEQKTKGRKSREFLELLIASRNGDRPYERKGVAGPVPFRSCGTGRGSSSRPRS